MRHGERDVRPPSEDPWPRVELAGRRYVILTEAAYDRLRRSALGRGRDWLAADASSPFGEDKQSLGQRIADRRHEAGVTQAALAREAGVRAETLNRIERGRTMPDFATVRKLVEALGRLGNPKEGNR